MQKKGVKLNQESQVRHLLAEKGEDQIQRTPEHYGGHLHEEKDKIKSNSPKNAMVLTCMQREGVAARAQLCLLFICSTDDQVGFNGKVFAKRIHLRPQLTFSFLISELFFSRAKYTSFHFHCQLQTEEAF